MKVRIEIHLEKNDVKLLDKYAKEQGRSRKNLCEIVIKNLIEEVYVRKKQTGSNGA